jgi:transposase
MADEEGLRRDAVRRHLSGEDAASIAADLGRSERWVYKWVARYEAGREDWIASESRRPLRSPRATDEDLAGLVLAARDRLEADPRAQRGAAAVAWELLAMGVAEEAVPAARTIERIIRRAGKSRPRRAVKGRYEPKGTPYPRTNRCRPGVLHQADPVGPRYLDGAQEVHSLNVMDVGSHRVALEPMARPTPQAFAEHLVAAWSRLGIPRIAQFDNAPSLRGDIGKPRVFGPVVRACLDLGVTVRYIALEEPWRNGAVEHFQGVFDKSFFRTERFRDLHHLADRALAFEAFHNARHRYSTLGGRTPDEAWAAADKAPRWPPDGYTVPERLPRRGRIEVIRLIRSDRLFNLFGEKIPMPEDTVHQYALAVIHVRGQRLVVTCSGEVVHEAPHSIR